MLEKADKAAGIPRDGFWEKAERSVPPLPSQKDWQTSTHDGETFLLFQGQDAGILFIAPGFSPWHVNAMVATLNAYFPTEPAKR